MGEGVLVLDVWVVDIWVIHGYLSGLRELIGVDQVVVISMIFTRKGIFDKSGRTKQIHPSLLNRWRLLLLRLLILLQLRLLILLLLRLLILLLLRLLKLHRRSHCHRHRLLLLLHLPLVSLILINFHHLFQLLVETRYKTYLGLFALLNVRNLSLNRSYLLLKIPHSIVNCIV
jgi:hypothetical protein